MRKNCVPHLPKIELPSLPLHCPPFGQRCSKCGGWNHFAPVCHSHGTRQSSIRGIDIGEDGGPTTSVVGEDFDVLAPMLDEQDAHTPEKVNAIGRGYQGRSVIKQLNLYGRPIKFQLDTGSACNVLYDNVIYRKHLL